MERTAEPPPFRDRGQFLETPLCDRLKEEINEKSSVSGLLFYFSIVSFHSVSWSSYSSSPMSDRAFFLISITAEFTKWGLSSTASFPTLRHVLVCVFLIAGPVDLCPYLVRLSSPSL